MSDNQGVNKGLEIAMQLLRYRMTGKRRGRVSKAEGKVLSDEIRAGCVALGISSEDVAVFERFSFLMMSQLGAGDKFAAPRTNVRSAPAV